jgi:hypothetical protein
MERAGTEKDLRGADPGKGSPGNETATGVDCTNLPDEPRVRCRPEVAIDACRFLDFATRPIVRACERREARAAP